MVANVVQLNFGESPQQVEVSPCPQQFQVYDAFVNPCAY